MKNNNEKQIKHLTRALLVSVLLNTFLLALSSYLLSSKTLSISGQYAHRPTDSAESQPIVSSHSLAEALSPLIHQNFSALVRQLNNKEFIESGYCQRDLALACLVSLHKFNIARALHNLPGGKQTRTLTLGESQTISLFTGLLDSHFEAIIYYASVERWPLTSQGLFEQLKQRGNNAPTSLREAFSLTSEFLALEMLFTRTGVAIGRDELIQMAIEGPWDMLKTFTLQQRTLQDLSATRRQQLLLDYIASGSKMAAYLLLCTDAALAIQKLNDSHIIALLNLLDTKSPIAEKFALAMLISPRSDAVWSHAAQRLYGFAGEEKPKTFQYKTALQRFAPHAMAIAIPIPAEAEAPAKAETITQIPFVDKKKTPSALPSEAAKKPATKPKVAETKIIASTLPAKRCYIIQEGDTLWKISKRYNISIENLRQCNNLKNDLLFKGKVLYLP